jgi:asparagine synthase (glutamine-hydrolysing)
MSIIFGLRNAEGQTVEERTLLDLGQRTNRYALDGTFVRTSGLIGMGFQPFHTHYRSGLEQHPVADECGNVLAFDGRLDNHAELGKLLDIPAGETADTAIILAAFRRWGEHCFSRLVGDWALSLWSHADRDLYLARDHAGSRTLYFEQESGGIVWSTFLETFFTETTVRDLDEGFAACYLACMPIRDLTPHKNVRAVPPACFLKFRENHFVRSAHWQWMAKSQIRYKSDTEYEEHFFSLFKQSVERRTGPGAPILAHLSGGMDSTSIVCMSDHIRREQGAATRDLIDTLSYYDDSEPSWNERPYFTAVEEKRGKCGIHVQTSFLDQSFAAPHPSQGRCLLPGADSGSLEREKKLHARIDQVGYRIILSGIGGDEVLGGVPTPLPELADYLVSGRFDRLLGQAMAWALVSRKPVVRILFETIRFTATLYRKSPPNKDKIPPWLQLRFRKLCSDLSNHAEFRENRFGVSPSAISNGLAWWSIMESLPHLYPSMVSRHEYRYPYLDRDLVDFLFRLPREQMVRPGRRRSLMRRALGRIVPPEILERRRKAFLVRGPIVALEASRTKIQSLMNTSLAGEYGWISPELLSSSLEHTIEKSDPTWSVPIMKAIGLELWLKGNQSTLKNVILGWPAEINWLSSGANDFCA